jgi:hypothetical protein
MKNERIARVDRTPSLTDGPFLTRCRNLEAMFKHHVAAEGEEWKRKEPWTGQAKQ